MAVTLGPGTLNLLLTERRPPIPPPISGLLFPDVVLGRNSFLDVLKFILLLTLPGPVPSTPPLTLPAVCCGKDLKIGVLSSLAYVNLGFPFPGFFCAAAS